MQTTGSHRRRKTKKISASELERRDHERRTGPSEGYTYIPMVGWYCRRKIARRSYETDH